MAQTRQLMAASIYLSPALLYANTYISAKMYYNSVSPSATQYINYTQSYKPTAFLT